MPDNSGINSNRIANLAGNTTRLRKDGVMPISSRQAQLLRIIIEEYVKSKEAIGSENIVAKYNLGVSPATVRNEMAALAQEGYLDQPRGFTCKVGNSIGIFLSY